MDAPEDLTPGPDFSDLGSSENLSAVGESAKEQGALSQDPFQELAQPLDTAVSATHDSSVGQVSLGDSDAVETLAQRVLPLAEASYLAGVSVQALRQRIKRGTLRGTDAVDSRGQSVAGVMVRDLQKTFPQRCFESPGATRSNAPDPYGAARGRSASGVNQRSLEGVAQGPDGDFLFGEATGQDWDADLRGRGRGPGPGDQWDPQADLERGGMAPPPNTGPVPEIDPSGFPVTRRQAAQGFGVGLWGIALIVALAAVGVTGLLTGAREVRSASRRLDTSYQHEVLLLEELKSARKERDLAQARADSLAQKLKDLGQVDPNSSESGNQ